jgi:hypothetical protein
VGHPIKMKFKDGTSMKKHIKKNIIFEDVAQFFIALVAGE